jgi:hypothetical protein
MHFIGLSDGLVRERERCAFAALGVRQGQLKGLFPKSTKSKKFKIYVIDGATCHDLALLFALKIS